VLLISIGIHLCVLLNTSWFPAYWNGGKSKHAPVAMVVQEQSAETSH
jgi:hypothetical protein